MSKFGFGFLRLPLDENKQIDIEETKQMVDLYMQNGFNFFDTAHGYMEQRCEQAFKTCVADRYSRDKYILSNKLTGNYFSTEDDIYKLFQEQLDNCGVEYFDYYLLHNFASKRYNSFVNVNANAINAISKLKAEGKIKKIGFSFHDNADFLDKVLNEFPELEVVLIQFNYIDFESQDIQSRRLYEVCQKHNKEILVMEPVKGGKLANLPPNARECFDKLGNNSSSSYALRFVADFKDVSRVLSGMSSLEQMQDNLSTFVNYKQLENKG